MVIIAVALFVSDAEQRKKIVDLTLTSIFGIVTGVTGYFFGSKSKKE